MSYMEIKQHNEWLNHDQFSRKRAARRDNIETAERRWCSKRDETGFPTKLHRFFNWSIPNNGIISGNEYLFMECLLYQRYRWHLWNPGSVHYARDRCWWRWIAGYDRISSSRNSLLPMLWKEIRNCKINDPFHVVLCPRVECYIRYRRHSTNCQTPLGAIEEGQKFGCSILLMAILWFPYMFAIRFMESVLVR